MNQFQNDTHDHRRRRDHKVIMELLLPSQVETKKCVLQWMINNRY
jgi:hypothetical protein